MGKKILFIILFTLTILLALIWLLNPFCLFEKDNCECMKWKHYSKAIETIQKIEDFRKHHDKLPDSLEEVGYEPEEKVFGGPIFYRKINSKNYIIWFGTYLGESCTYHSDTKTWTPY
jgi:hypothetical protein